ncbi:Hypothetical protein A7982_07642 [Minicystis rosea]|nr:Hypothetical protein A7982_07642 [Minicystis rosea]
MFVSACVIGPESDDELVGTARSAALNGNALNGNALNGNALNGNALNGNALNGNGLQATAMTPSMLSKHPLRPSALGADALSALQDPREDGALSRQLLKYTVSCAFDPEMSFAFTWIDDEGTPHAEEYKGLLGLAPSWRAEPLTGAAQRWVSACLISRVNYFGVSVTLSSRGPRPELSASPEERNDYTMLEGAFWGNVFTDTPVAYACDHQPNDDHSRSRDRVCAAGYPDGSGRILGCGIIQRVGSCATTCTLQRGDHYTGCSAGAGQSSSDEVITVFLQ